MRIIPPVSVSDANLASTNIPEDDAPVWDVATEYGLGDTVIKNHSVYESLLAANTGNDPATDTVNWLYLGATNRYKPFDRRLSDRASYPDEITYTLDHNGEYISAVAVFGLVGTTLEIEVTDPVDGVIFSETYMLLDNSGVVDWSTYFFSPVGVQRQEVLEVAIPPYLAASTRITVANPGGVAEVGQVALGRLLDLGVTVYGTSLSIEDYSRKDRDTFGNPVIVQRAFSQLIDYSISLKTPTVRRLQNTLAGYRTTPIVWVGDADEDLGTIVYGYYQRFDIVVSSPTLSDASIEVEGLI